MSLEDPIVGTLVDFSIMGTRIHYYSMMMEVHDLPSLGLNVKNSVLDYSIASIDTIK